jgi:hypothetical protein
MDKELAVVFVRAWLGSFAWQIPSFFSALKKFSYGVIF